MVLSFANQFHSKIFFKNLLIHENVGENKNEGNNYINNSRKYNFLPSAQNLKVFFQIPIMLEIANYYIKSNDYAK